MSFAEVELILKKMICRCYFSVLLIIMDLETTIAEVQKFCIKFSNSSLITFTS